MWKTLRGSMESKFKKLSFWRKKARFLFRVLLAMGFIIQSVKFVEMYLHYPSSVELEVVQPSNVELPAITICNINEIRSTPYCNKYPKYCGTPDSDPDFCVHFAEYCNLVNNTKKVLGSNPGFAHRCCSGAPCSVTKLFFRHLTRYEQQVLGHQYHNLVSTCTIETDDEEYNCSNSPGVESRGVRISPLPLVEGAQLSIHSPYHVPSPVSEGLFLNLGTLYRIYVRVAEKNLLPRPYKSRCTDYEKQWKENGGMGPVTEKMCKEKCKLEKSLYFYKCAERRIDYPHNESICPNPIINFMKNTSMQCAPSCSSPCRIRRYEVQIQEADSEGTRKSCVTASDLSCATLVHIIFENLEITTFTYTPRFEPIGILSFIGGYVGLWLGISLLTVYDFLETRIFRLISAAKRKCMSRKGKMRVSAVPHVAKRVKERSTSLHNVNFKYGMYTKK
ncbi:uncharacterized protein CEXT_220421 [Caerostris extrusa]|uniref:Uncharacterized protein n=1 Tax=Caerostris extrusa TaxID=172846 RepID=A0AAV4T3M9_CAEEX|nr:uncharacterized protein CEXT_220421 [Caerostris extrusa]